MEDSAAFSPWPGLAPFAHTFDAGMGRRLFYYDTGTEKPLLALVHGLGDEADSWRRVIPPLSESFRVIAPDLPGFGRSVFPGRITVARHVRALLDLLEHCGAAEERPAALAGNSMGSLVAECAAIARPGLVRTLLLIDGAFPAAVKAGPAFLLACLPGFGSQSYRRFRRDHEGAWRSLFPYYANIDTLDAADRDFLRRRVIDRVESRTQERAYFDSFRSLVWKQIAGGAKLGRDIAAWRAGGGKLRLIWGEKDRILPPETASTMRALARDPDFTLIENAGHLPHQEQPEQTVRAILAAF